MSTVNINNEILKARANNYIDLVVEEFDKICKERKDDIGAMVEVCNGEWLMEAVDNVALKIQSDSFDNMLIPRENSK